MEEKAADVADETTRNSLAKFNEQMGGMYTMLKKFENVQFSRELLEFGPLADGQAEDEDLSRVLTLLGSDCAIYYCSVHLRPERG